MEPLEKQHKSLNGLMPNEDFFLYTQQWRNGLLAFMVKVPEGDTGFYPGQRVLLLHAYGEYEDWFACPLGEDADPLPSQRLNPFGSSSREFSSFEEGLAWLLQDLNTD